MLTEWEGSDSLQRSPVTTLIYLQTLVLMMIEADNRVPTTGGPSKESLIGRAVAAAYSAKLYMSAIEAQPDGEPDSESDDRLQVRVWWTLVLLDRWNAIGTGTPSLIRDDSVVVPSGLQAIIGELPFMLIRKASICHMNFHLANCNFPGLSKILARASAIISNTPVPLASTTVSDRMMGSFFDSWIEDFREDLPAHVDPISYPILHLTYWHSRLLAYLMNPSSKSTDLAWAAKESVNLLLEHAHVTSPLNHHFSSLTALCLFELVKIERTREEANGLLNELYGTVFAPSSWDSAIRESIADNIRPSTSTAQATSSVEATASQGLQHLADLAVTAHGLPLAVADKTDDPAAAAYRMSCSYEDMGFDPRSMLTNGYLNVIRETHV
jgi:hypothetical protein